MRAPPLRPQCARLGAKVYLLCLLASKLSAAARSGRLSQRSSRQDDGATNGQFNLRLLNPVDADLQRLDEFVLSLSRKLN